MWDVSRVTVREALRTLENSGLIKIKPGTGGGAVITQINFAAVESNLNDFFRFGGVSLENLSEVRLIIEPAVAELAAYKRTEEDLAELESVIIACRELINDNNPNIVAQVNFHRVLVKSSKNPVLIATLNSIMNLLSDELEIIEPDLESFQKDLEFHEKIFELIKNQDGSSAKKAMIDHVITHGSMHLKAGHSQD